MNALISNSLVGIRIVDATGSIAGPYASMLLAACGADVVKVENASTGDDIRNWAPPFWGSDAASFLAMNPGKRSLAVDLKRKGGTDLVLRLAEASDVFLQSWRPGVAERLGVGFEQVKDRNPRIVYGSVSAYGNRGPLQDHPGYDPLAQAMTGVMSLTGDADGPPARCGVSLMDQATGMWLAFGVLIGLRERDRTGTAQRIDTSLFETGLGWVGYRAAGFFATGDVPHRSGSSFDLVVPYQAFNASDGPLMVAAANDRTFRHLCKAMDLAQVADDSRFDGNAARVSHKEELIETLEARFRGRSVQDWLERLARAGVPAAPILTLEEALAHPQADALGVIQDVDYSAIEDFRLVSLPVRLNDEYPRYPSAPPRLGEHTEEVLGGLGLDREEIDALVERGVISDAGRADEL